ncbi:5-oxoprolinase subunit PxpB [Dyella sp. C9]|uniref:5-oxoprolinase subunit PxpB n=1 Tax=Dyella sp. C9 TaxID=2202154 RepID=UPI000DEF3FB6|nr:5-oxoprolinase subunit PxpB [Dyella sp. C9]
MTSPWPGPTIEPLAEDALLLRFGDAMDAVLNARVHAAAARLRTLIATECVPAYASLLLRFDPLSWQGADGQAALERVREAVLAALQSAEESPVPPREIVIPVCYGGEHGPDIEAVARHAGLEVAQVIERHAAARYQVAMLGFAPGFPYLLGLDETLAMPRRADPRLRVPAGSVAIGGRQTGIYPQELPGGWHLIGRTPWAVFDLRARAPALLRPGDHVRFQPIDAVQYRQLSQATDAAR